MKSMFVSIIISMVSSYSLAGERLVLARESLPLTELRNFKLLVNKSVVFPPLDGMFGVAVTSFSQGNPVSSEAMHASNFGCTLTVSSDSAKIEQSKLYKNLRGDVFSDRKLVITSVRRESLQYFDRVFYFIEIADSEDQISYIRCVGQSAETRHTVEDFQKAFGFLVVVESKYNPSFIPLL